MSQYTAGVYLIRPNYSTRPTTTNVNKSLMLQIGANLTYQAIDLNLFGLAIALRRGFSGWRGNMPKWCAESFLNGAKQPPLQRPKMGNCGYFTPISGEFIGPYLYLIFGRTLRDFINFESRSFAPKNSSNKFWKTPWLLQLFAKTLIKQQTRYGKISVFLPMCLKNCVKTWCLHRRRIPFHLQRYKKNTLFFVS